ncbi:MAG: 50S ribosomal protein L4 [Candidatus Diapherotrites archaeon]|uniref:50S ribosomal protein L4 n=1 Tax=Candidatus Iainarchaeum sp. TaxID=3101447 RepID=A0A8T3YIN5_9ARCH|nr:50S ribosomal protein L4 [Candidatus Diapherotrites archaeon]
MKAQVISIEGKKVSEIELPRQFSADINEGLIRRAVLAIQSARVQPHYPTPHSGRYNTALYVGARGKPTMHRTINVGHARKPRLKNRRGLLAGQVAGIPGVVGGPKAHPPKLNKVWAEKINEKEKRTATASAISATADAKLVKKRGHLFSDSIHFPIVVEAKFEELDRTKRVADAFRAIGVIADVEKARAKKTIRAGKGKKRGRAYKRRKSVLVVAANTAKINMGARNLEGVDVIAAKSLNANVLAPGALPGRLTIWTEGAIKELAKNELKPGEAKA